MKNEIKDRSGKVLFITEQVNNKLNIADAKGEHFCCIEHDGEKLNIKDKSDKIVDHSLKS